MASIQRSILFDLYVQKNHQPNEQKIQFHFVTAHAHTEIFRQRKESAAKDRNARSACLRARYPKLNRSLSP